MMIRDCSYCGPSALRTAAFADMRPNQVVDVKKKKKGTLVKCLCCHRRWISNAKWTLKA